MPRETLKGLQDVYWSDDEVGRHPSLELHYLAHLAATCMRFNSALTVHRGKELIQQDDPDCLLCAEPLDLSDLNFKPCQCGMQVSLSSFSV